MILTVCNNCDLRREGRHNDPCPYCDASPHRQSWIRLDDPKPEPEPEPESEPEPVDKRMRLIEKYKSLYQQRAREESKRFSDQAKLNWCENTMASIEAQFQAWGEDLSLYL